MGLSGQDQVQSQIVANNLAGIPPSVTLNTLYSAGLLKKEIVYKELDRVPVVITDTDPLSPNYLRITYLPDEFNLGKNLIRIRPNIPVFEEESQLYVEIIDYNGDPIYHEIELNSETSDNYIIISVYIYEDTPPGPCAIYLLGTLKNVPVPANNKIYPVNFRWSQIINVDTSEKTKSPIIFTTLPSVTVLSNTASYEIASYQGGEPFTSSIYYNLQLHNGYLNPSITALNSTDIFSSSMDSGILYVKYEDVQLISPPRFLSNFLLGSGITASIKDYVSNKSLTLDEPIVIYQQNRSDQLILKSAIFKTASIAYEQDPISTIQSAFKKRILTVQFNDLDPFTGQVRNIKTFYRDTALKSTEFLLLSDFLVPSTNVDLGFNPLTASFNLVLPDSEIDEHFDIRFEFYNNELLPSLQALEVKNVLAEGTPTVITNNNGFLMVDPDSSTLDGKNLVRTLYQDYDIHCVHTSSFRLSAGSTAVSKSLASFTGYIPQGSKYISLFYNTAILNITEQTLPEDIGLYSYKITLQAYEMGTSSYTNFAYPIDEIDYPIVASSSALITISSDYASGHTVFGYPVKQVMQLPETDKLYRFSLDHSLIVPYSSSTVPDFFDFNTVSAWDGLGVGSLSSGQFSRYFSVPGTTYVTQSIPSLTIGNSYLVSLSIPEFDPPGFVYVSIGAPTPTSIASPSGSGYLTVDGNYNIILTPGQAPETNNFYVYISALNGNQTITVDSLQLKLLNISSASFDASASIKDINIVSSGYLFVSGSQDTYISGAFDYIVPSI